MQTTVWMPPSEKDYRAAKHQFVELYGSVAVMNTYLKIALLCLSLVGIGLTILNMRTYEAYHNLKPLVIRINELGRAEAVNYASLEYQPQEAELKYFLVQFVEAHYARMHATIREAYPRSFYFLDGRLANALIEANKKAKVIETFLAGSSEETEVEVKNVAIEDLRKPPYKATVEFEKIFLAEADHRELRRERFMAHFVFIINQPVANALIPVNPLGITITYFRQDQAFQ